MKILVALAGLGVPLAAQTSYLVKDINLEPGFEPWSFTEQFTTVGGTTFFVATTFELGTELWKSVGGAAAVPVTDINPVGDADPQDLVEFGGLLYFTAVTPAAGRELWRSDGTAAGTTLVADLSPGAGGSDPAELVVAGGELFFSARAAGLGRELYKSDGTAGGTGLVLDIFPGNGWSSPTELTAFDGQLFLRANDGADGEELWRSDGTALGTVQVADLFPGPLGSFPAHLSALPSGLYLSAFGTLGREPYRVTSAAGAATLVADIETGAGSSDPGSFEEHAGLVYFSAATAATGLEVFRTDGTPGGTSLFLDIAAGADGSTPSEFLSTGSLLLFVAKPPSTVPDVWVSDGTPGGSFTVGKKEYGVGDFVLLGGNVFYIYLNTMSEISGTTGATAAHFAHTQLGNELYSDGALLWFTVRGDPWSSDGTPGGPLSAGELQPFDVTDDSQPLYPAVAGDKLLFTADAGTGHELWVSDGTEAGTALLYESPPWKYSVDNLRSTWDEVYFTAFESLFVEELWVTGGTQATTRKVADLDPFGSPQNLEVFAHLDGVAYFAAAHPVEGAELWRSDGTSAGTFVIADLNPGVFDASVTEIVPFAGSIHFLAQNASPYLWKTDGTGAGTVALDPTLTGAFELTVHGDLLFFQGQEPTIGAELFTVDASGTVAPVVDLVPGSDGSWPRDLHSATHGVVFLASDGSPAPRALWTSDGTAGGTSLLLQPGTGEEIDDDHMAAAGGQVYFFVNDGTERRLWSTDGTAAGTAPVGDTTGMVYFTTRGMVPVGSGQELLLAMNDGFAGYEVWLADPDGAALFADLTQEDGGSDPFFLGRAGDLVYFSADDSVHGRELHAIPFVETGGYVAEVHGVGCPGTGGVVPSIGSSTAPLLGTTYDVELSDALPLSVAVLLHSFGVEPLALGPCDLYTEFPFFLTGTAPTNAGGEAAFTLTFPSASALTGVSLYLQYLVADPDGAYIDLASFTGVLEVLVGP